MRDETDLLLRQMAALVIESQGAKSLQELFGLSATAAAKNPDWPASLRTLLHVAGGWLYFGQEKQAEPVLKATRDLLLAKTLPDREQMPLGLRRPLSRRSPRLPEAHRGTVQEP
jgi:hypothetical protein